MPGFSFTHLRRECELLEHNSRRYAGDLAGRLESYASNRPEGLLEAARERLLLWAADARAAAHMPAATLELSWPWESGSPAVSILLDEALGISLRAAGMRPFADRLMLMHGGTLGHASLQQRCAMFFGPDVYTALPPVSDTLAEFMARFGWTGRGLDPDSVTLNADDEGVLVSMVLTGTGRVCVKKRYEGDDIIIAEENDVPQVSLWPGVPLPRDRWSLYSLSCRGDLELHYLSDGEWAILPQPEAEPVTADPAPDAPDQPEPVPQPEPIRPLDPCRVVRTDVMPACVSVHRGGKCLGALLYSAAPYHPQEKGVAVISLDAGSSGTAMAMLLDGAVQPVSVPPLRHVMVCGAREDLPGEALPAWQMGPVLPSCVELYADTDGAEPLLDGRVCPEQAIDALTERGITPVYDLMRRTDAEAARARVLLWRESMLLCAFHAVMCGASGITWRVVLPDDALPEDRRRLLEEVRHTQSWLASACPMAQTTVQDPYGMRGLLVSALELRDSGTLRGAFLLMNIGAASTGMALWLRGMNRPALEFITGRGVPGMLLDELIRRPGMLVEDFKPLRLPESRLKAHEGATQEAWSADRVLLDSLLGVHLTETAGLMNNLARAGAMTRTQALLLLGFAEQMTLAGMALEQVGMNSLLNDYLPPDMTIAIGGRGAQVLAAMDPALRGPLTSFVRVAMAPDHRVRTIRLTAAGDARLTPVFGLCRLRTLPEKPVTAAAAFTADRQPLLQITARFLSQLRMNWPVLCNLLFAGIFTPEGTYTPEGQDLVTQVVNSTDGTVQARFSEAIARIRAACALPEGDGRA